MAALLPDYEGKVNLIYSDSTIFYQPRLSGTRGTGRRFAPPKRVETRRWIYGSLGRFRCLPGLLVSSAGVDAPAAFSYGTFYLHLDWHANAYARLLLDEIFGPERFLNEIIWCYHGPSPIRSAFNRKHDTLLVYTKGKPIPLMRMLCACPTIQVR